MQVEFQLIDTGERRLPDATQTLGADGSDPTCGQRMKLMSSSGVFDFWNDPEEDVY